MYIKKCGILGLVLSISVFAEMEVENDGRGFLNANVNLSGVNLKEKKNIRYFRR